MENARCIPTSESLFSGKVQIEMTRNEVLDMCTGLHSLDFSINTGVGCSELDKG